MSVVSRADVDRLSASQRAVVELAVADLRELLGWMDFSSPAQVRDVVLDILPGLVAQYGDLAASAAAEWYETLRPGAFTATTVAGPPAEQVQGVVRFAAGHLFDGDPAAFSTLITGAVQRLVAYSGRETIARNVQLDPLRPRFARVPSGAVTCAFCLMTASRGWVYHSRETAGEFSQFHDHCDCQIVPQWESQRAHIEGFDPDALFEVYLEARSRAGSSDTNEILAAIRELGGVTDAHVH